MLYSVFGTCSLHTVTLGSACVATILLCSCLPLFADDDGARAVVKKAVVVHGGRINLIKLQKAHIKANGVTYHRGTRMEFESEKWEHLPLCTRVSALLIASGAKETELRVVTPEQCWVKHNDDKAVAVPLQLRAIGQASLYARYLTTLVPLLEEKNVSLAGIGESVLDHQTVIGVSATLEGKIRSEFFFDKGTGYLVKWRWGAWQERKMPAEEYFYEYAEFHGVKYPKRTVSYFDGKLAQERRVIEIELLKTADKRLFDVP